LVKALEVGKPAGQGLVLGIWFLFMVGLGRGVIWWKGGSGGVNCVMDSVWELWGWGWKDLKGEEESWDRGERRINERRGEKGK